MLTTRRPPRSPPALAPGESVLVRLSNVSNDAFGKSRKPVEIGYLLPGE